MEIVEHCDESKLEETCVLVEADKLHVPQGSVKRKSYKVPSPSLPFLLHLYLVFLAFPLYAYDWFDHGGTRGGTVSFQE